MNALRQILLISFTVSGLYACSTAPIVQGEPEPPAFTPERVGLTDTETPFLVNDPFEGMNRTMYRFNYHLDRWVMMPMVRTYRTIIPGFMRKGVFNFFNNFFEIRTFANQLLQFRPVRSLQTGGRFAVNSTIGIAGLFDVASHWGMPYHREDFGQTLGVWGVGAGPYLVLPLLGPNSMRGTVGLGVDSAFMTWLDPLNLDGSNSEWQYVYYPLYAIDSRDRVSFQYHGTGSPFEYDLVRRLILIRQQIEVEK